MNQLSGIFVFDIETIPDLETVRRAWNVDATVLDNSLRDQWASEERPIKPAWQQIVAIAGAWIEPNGALRYLGALGSENDSEAALVRIFFQVVARHRPRLVGWNSGGFDLPVLVYRAMVHRIPAPAFYQIGEPYHSYRKRFDEESHIDLMDVLSFYGASPRLKLDEMAQVLGIPGKLGVDGGQVWDLYQSGDLATIRRYCMTDVLTTALIYSRYAEHRGWCSADQVTTFEQSVVAWLEAQDDPIWARFLDQWTARLPQVLGRQSWDDGQALSDGGADTMMR
ncbi:putative 3'-5' exonuclease [Sulfobacillus acidophilus TPY]|uniref:3'-5' exonuclease, PolB n=1 Tax=Sulfobacillus acidophilus (strain ATCC 700253 / DSM 10332 / NAL) TaxID=679936 RepID=G8TU10_SULAD|nr:putative 3'-5' exonuclease [Sulfobacillus acidophilus TPY]AEW04601.1 3'-5' exonuclease, PolB [Sulfobacillus acidophilus DSM 10332]